MSLLGIFGGKRRFDVPDEEIRRIAVERAAEVLRDVASVVEQAGLCDQAGAGTGEARGIYQVAYLAYATKLAEIQAEHKVREPVRPSPLHSIVGAPGMPPVAVACPFSPELVDGNRCALCGMHADHPWHRKDAPPEPS